MTLGVAAGCARLCLMPFDTPPTPENRFLAEHVLLRDSLKQWTGRELVPYGLSAEDAE
jgi:hypothetical protein